MSDDPRLPATGDSKTENRPQAVRPKRVVLAYSQSNFRNVAEHAWFPPANLFVFNGGLDGAIGSLFLPCPGDEMRVPYAIVAHLAEADPGTDYHLLICATGGVGVRAVIGMPYHWRSTVAGDPGPGGIGFDSATPEGAGQIRYAASDLDGHLRFRDNTDLAETGKSKRPARIMVGDPRAPHVRFKTLGPGSQTDDGYRVQDIEVVASPGWPPLDGTRVTVYPAQENLRAVIQRNAKAVFDALGRQGDQRVFDLVLIWPTESDAGYYTAYAASDHDRLIEFLSRWTSDATRFIYTLPWPHHPDRKVAATIRRWWAEIARLVAHDPGRRVLVSLEATTVSDWKDIGNIHTGDGDSKARIGRMIAEAALRAGMVPTQRAELAAGAAAAEGEGASGLRSLLRRITRKRGS